jgi:hypothetical protein
MNINVLMSNIERYKANANNDGQSLARILVLVLYQLVISKYYKES